MQAWTPSSFEDRLLKKHFESNPGTAYLELPVSISGELDRARRIDAVLIPGETTMVYQQGAYLSEEAAEAIAGQSVHAIEAKRALNRGVIGQVMVARHLLESTMRPLNVVMSVVCARDNTDLQIFCKDRGIEVSVYPGLGRRSSPRRDGEGRVDLRRPADEARRRAFLGGWTQAVNGQLFGSIDRTKTYANMGNLFGWIYGDQPEVFRLETWRRYVDNVAPTEAGEGETG